MIGFLIKLILVVALVVGLGSGLSSRLPGTIPIKLPTLPSLSVSGKLPSISLSSLTSSFSSALDSLVTHPGRSPVVMGIEITNESLEAVVDTLQNLPPDQLNLVRTYLCAQPTTTPTGTSTPSASR